LSGVKDNVEYGYTIALGAAEITMLDLANGYMHLSAQGKPAKIDPILEIR
jgi:membrane carboxypeptidase/penicillin-binding protein PbpC